MVSLRILFPSNADGWGAWAFTFAMVADPQKLVNGSGPDSLTRTMVDRFIVYRENTVHNNGGFAVGATVESERPGGPRGLIGDVLLEHNRIRLSDAPEVVNKTGQCSTAFVRNHGDDTAAEL
jgi:hypothetical protein